jgi:hypothetical protein
VSLALALTVIAAGAMNAEPAAGEVIDTDGGVFTGKSLTE